jgi:hypothetical protein
VFFENTACVSCGHVLAYLPDQRHMAALELDEGDLWHSLPSLSGVESRSYRLCRNYREENVCNWAIPADKAHAHCESCRLTRTIPNLGEPANRDAWARLEVFKRRLIYSLQSLDLPLASKQDDPQGGLTFDFLADPTTPDAPKVLTGHDEGVITINIAEADDAEREKRRHLMHEPYRTLLGHFRHEVGHYYWDHLIKDSEWLDGFRNLFGDEREDYNRAIQAHHADGAPADWPRSFVSAYASSHPWEDWAETWAHYLHIVDTLETAIECGLSLTPKRKGEPAMKPDIELDGERPTSFDQVIDRWFPLTYVLNNLNRGMGLADAYPFVLSAPAVEKLRFIHEVVGAVSVKV